MIVGGFYIIAGLILIILRTHAKIYVIPTAEQPHVWENVRDGIPLPQQKS